MMMFSLFIWSSALALIFNTIALGILKSGYFQWNGISIYPTLILFSFAVTLFYLVRKKKDFLSELIEIDSRFQLKDRLSTAFEYHQSNRNSRFLGKLMADAGVIFGRIPKNEVYRNRFSVPYIIISLCAVFITILLFVDFSRSVPEEDRSPKRLAQIRMRMEKFSKDNFHEAVKKDDQSQAALYRQLDEIARELKKQSLSEEKLLHALGKIKNDARAERERLTLKLHNGLGGSSTVGPSGEAALQKETKTPKDVDKMEDQLKELFDENLPQSLSKDISNIRENLQIEQFVNMTIDQTKSSAKDRDKMFLLEKEENVPQDNRAEKKSDRPSSGNNLASVPTDKEGTKQSMTPPSGRGKGNDERGNERHQGQESDEVYTAGSGKGKGEKQSPNKIQSAKGRFYRDQKSSSGPEQKYNVHVRSLPVMGKTNAKEEELSPDRLSPYQDAVEAVLKKEEIPVEYRNTIKNYFLSIGLRKGKKQNDNTN